MNQPSTQNPAGPDLVRRLSEADGPADLAGDWPESLWSILVDAGATRWVLPPQLNGAGLDRPTAVEANAQIARGSLTAAFILSQHDAATRRLLASAERPVATYWLDALSTGDAFATVGLSQLTTSRRLGATALVARPDG